MKQQVMALSFLFMLGHMIPAFAAAKRRNPFRVKWILVGHDPRVARRRATLGFATESRCDSQMAQIRIGPKPTAALGRKMGMAFSHIDSKGQQAVKCSHEASSIRKLAAQDTDGSFVYSKFGAIMKAYGHLLRLGWLVIPLLSGCGESTTKFLSRIDQYREPLNSSRITKDIPRVPANWLPRRDGSAAAWDSPGFVYNKAPGHQYKFLTFSDPFYNRGTLVSETDHYENGKVWQDPAEGTQVEFARITYSYEDERAGRNPWHAEVCRQETGIIPQRMSLEEATAVLKAWGITRIKQDGSQTNQQGGTNRRQPIRSETNRVPSAAGLRR